tara:strand:+ start:341 stop:745 length:405 start_codon:yes stop_codon:yes gene_type:complete
MLNIMHSPKQRRRTAWQMDQVILSAAEVCDNLTLPCASDLLNGMVPCSPAVQATEPEPIIDDEPCDIDTVQGSPDLRRSRLARRWYKGLSAKSSLDEERAATASLLDLHKLASALEHDDSMPLPPSPTSIIEPW